MKAKEYLDKYIDEIRMYQDNDKMLFSVVGRIFVDFQREATEIMEQRKVLKLPAAMGVIEEQNKKWNALERRIEQLGIRPVLKKNGFLLAKLKQLEEDKQRMQNATASKEQEKTDEP